MKIVYHMGNIHFIDVVGKNYVIPDGAEGKILKDTILIMSKCIEEELFPPDDSPVSERDKDE